MKKTCIFGDTNQGAIGKREIEAVRERKDEFILKTPQHAGRKSTMSPSRGVVLRCEKILFSFGLHLYLMSHGAIVLR